MVQRIVENDPKKWRRKAENEEEEGKEWGTISRKEGRNGLSEKKRRKSEGEMEGRLRHLIKRIGSLELTQ